MNERIKNQTFKIKRVFYYFVDFRYFVKFPHSEIIQIFNSRESFIKLRFSANEITHLKI